MRKSQFTKALTTALPPEHYERIKQITDEKCISMGEWVRDAVDAALEKLQSKEDMMDD